MTSIGKSGEKLFIGFDFSTQQVRLYFYVFLIKAVGQPDVFACRNVINRASVAKPAFIVHFFSVVIVAYVIASQKET